MLDLLRHLDFPRHHKTPVSSCQRLSDPSLSTDPLQNLSSEQQDVGVDLDVDGVGVVDVTIKEERQETRERSF